MILSYDEAQKYTIDYCITYEEVVRLARHAPSTTVLELCLEFTKYGYYGEDMILMLDSTNQRHSLYSSCITREKTA